jgi:autotransporter-associated beta strand protein
MSTHGLRRREGALGLLIALGLSACGGGGGNVRPTPTTPPPAPPPPSSSVPPPPVDAQLSLTDSYMAHNLGYTGQGVTIGIIDSGVMRNHPALAGRVAKEVIYVDPQANNTSVDDVVGHGTWVSEIAAGQPVGQFAGGIAPGATLVSARIIADKEPTDDGSGSGNKVTADDATFFGQYLNPEMISDGVRIQNNSWGGIYWDTTDPTVNSAFGKAYDDFVLNHDGLVVFAAGNDSKPNPSTIAALPNLAPELEQGWLVAAAVDSNHPTQLASYSNACGSAMRYCLVAPGDVIVADKDYPNSPADKSYWIVEGTSFAAPQVSGAAALVWQAYPYFNNDLVRQTLLGTADDLGAPGPDPVFGYGLLDVGKAVNGPAKFDWGDVTVNFSGTSSWSNPISGAGGLIKQGSGRLNLNVVDSYTGLTQVQGGTLAVTTLASPVQIGAQGMLMSADTPQNPTGFTVYNDVTNAGVLVVGQGNGNVTGNYVQQGNGRLAVTLGSQLSVNGTATLLGGDLYVYGANSNYTLNSHTTVLTAGSGLTGTFSALDTAPGVALVAALNYDTTSAWLDVQQVNLSQIYGLPYTTASFSAAERTQQAFEQINSQLQGVGSGTPVSAGFVEGAAKLQHAMSTEVMQHSLESLSGQLHAASAAMTFEAIDAGTRALSDRFDHLLDSGTAGGWTQNLGYHGGMQRAGYAHVGVDLSGMLAGQDMRVGSNGVAGFALSQAQGLGRLAESADQGRSHAIEGMLYGGLVHGNGYLMGRVGVGSYRQSTHRNLELGAAFAGVASDSHGRYEVAYGESGYRTSVGALTLTPYASLQYARIDSSGFNEPGAWGFGLKANAGAVERWQAGAGLRAARHWSFAGGGSLDLGAQLAWQRAFAMRGDVFEASFTGIDQWAPLGGIGLSRYGGVAGMTLDWSASPRSMLSFGIDQHFAQRERGSMATLAYRLSF